MAKAQKSNTKASSTKATSTKATNTKAQKSNFDFLIKTPSLKVQEFTMNVAGEKQHFIKGETKKGLNVAHLDWIVALNKSDGWVDSIERMLRYGAAHHLPLVLGCGYGGQLSCNAHSGAAFKNVIGIQDKVIFVTKNATFNIDDVPIAPCRRGPTWAAFNPHPKIMGKLLDWLEGK